MSKSVPNAKAKTLTCSTDYLLHLLILKVAIGNIKIVMNDDQKAKGYIFAQFWLLFDKSQKVLKTVPKAKAKPLKYFTGNPLHLVMIKVAFENFIKNVE